MRKIEELCTSLEVGEAFAEAVDAGVRKIVRKIEPDVTVREVAR